MDSFSAPLDAILAGLTNLPAAAWASLAGTLVGGTITFAIQERNHRRQRRKEDKDKYRRELALAISILLKTAKMYSSITHIRRQLEVALALATQHGITGEPPWQIVQPIVGKTPELLFSDDERILIVRELPKDYITVLEMADIHNDLTGMVEIYSSTRIDLAAQMPAQAIGGSFATTEIPQSELERLTPRMLNLQSLVGPMLSRSQQDREQAVEAFDLIKGMFAKKFPDDAPALQLDLSDLKPGNPANTQTRKPDGQQARKRASEKAR